MWRYPAARASSTARWVSSGGTWKTPKPTCGISTPSLSRTFGTSATGSGAGETDRDQREGDHEARHRADRHAAKEGGALGPGPEEGSDEADQGGEADPYPEDRWHQQGTLPDRPGEGSTGGKTPRRPAV